jgi:hypothetical protein
VEEFSISKGPGNIFVRQQVCKEERVPNYYQHLPTCFSE